MNKDQKEFLVKVGLWIFTIIFTAFLSFQLGQESGKQELADIICKGFGYKGHYYHEINPLGNDDRLDGNGGLGCEFNGKPTFVKIFNVSKTKN